MIYVNKTKFFLFLGVFAVELMILAGGTLAPLSQDQVQQNTITFNNIKTTVTPDPVDNFISIVANNINIAAFELVPGFGILIMAISAYSTGTVLQTIASIDNVPAPVLFGTLFLFPDTFIELGGYALAVAMSMYFVYACWPRISKRHIVWRDGARHEAAAFGMSIGLVAGVIAFAGIVEAGVIYLGGWGILLWIPIIIGIKFLTGWTTRGHHVVFKQQIGFSKPQEVIQPPVQPVVIHEGTLLTCQNCGAVLTPNDQFCHYCGVIQS